MLIPEGGQANWRSGFNSSREQIILILRREKVLVRASEEDFDRTQYPGLG